MDRASAETIGAEALAWMAGHEELIAGFMAQTGAGIDDLRARAADPEFLGFVLDHLLSDEAALIAFCEAQRIRPEDPVRARMALPGGGVPHWT